MRREYAFAIAIAAVILASCATNSNELEISSDYLNEFSLQGISEDESGQWVGEGIFDTMIKIQKKGYPDQESAQEYASDKGLLIESMYRDIDSPYPGALSNRIVCPEEFKPKKRENGAFDYYLLYATTRNTYGACSLDSIGHKALLFFLYCNSSRSLYQVEIFAPLDNDMEFHEKGLLSLWCS